jgi:hypothetical protein
MDIDDIDDRPRVHVDDRDLVPRLATSAVGPAAVCVAEEEPATLVVDRQLVRLGDQAGPRPDVLAAAVVKEVERLVDDVGHSQHNGPLFPIACPRARRGVGLRIIHT